MIYSHQQKHLHFSIFLLVAASMSSGCYQPRKLKYEQEELERELIAKAPTLSLEDVKVPFYVTPDQIDRAMEYTLFETTDFRRAEKLIQAILDPEEFGIEYADMETGTAAETLEAKKGNCLAIASVFVGLARGIGLKAYYMETTVSSLEILESDNFIVSAGHITAMVETESGRTGLDFGDQLFTFLFSRKMSDIEATAHFYNNRGYQSIHQALRREREIDWERAAANFSIATGLAPDFEPAWNNLGLANYHLGRFEEAIRCYRTAISLNPDETMAYSNYGNLLLSMGDVEKAIEAFTTAVELDPRSPHVHYRLGVALRRKGDMRGAADELERSLSLKHNFKKACAALEQIHKQQGKPFPSNCDKNGSDTVHTSKLMRLGL